MSDLDTATRNVERFRRNLVTHLNDAVPNAELIVASVEALILAQIQKTLAQMMGDLR